MRQAKPRDLCERTFLFGSEIVKFCLKLSAVPGAPRQIAGQLLRAGTSVGESTEEARAAYSRRDFACRNSLVLREAREARFWLRLIATTGLAREDAVNPLLSEAGELVGIFTVIVRKTKKPVAGH